MILITSPRDKAFRILFLSLGLVREELIAESKWQLGWRNETNILCLQDFWKKWCGGRVKLASRRDESMIWRE